RAAERYPVDLIVLVGSRARGWQGPTSDYDVVMLLGAECYTEGGEPVDRIEQRLAFDPDLCFEDLDLFFVRPHPDVGRWASLGRWMWGPDEEPPDDDDDLISDCIRSGSVCGDFSRLWDSIPEGKVLWGGQDAPGAP
ncbi:MAG TPA: nucleotidyltransferase domain-containing protein, partial [Anaerolineae bacterium]|nr:nucleotidyltransferase domain-containing protein [Anaerolineae bacterium]